MKTVYLLGIVILVMAVLAVTAKSDTIALPTTGQRDGRSVNRDANYSVAQLNVTANSGASITPSLPAYIAPLGLIDPKWARVAGWITPDANPMADLAGSAWLFRTTFPLPAGVAAINGSLFADDRVQIFFNGRLITELPNGVGSGYWTNSLSSFTITSGFLLGENTLEFRVLNDPRGTPVGLNVTKLSAETAEPFSLLLVGSGMAGLARLLRRKQKGQ